MEEQSVHYYNVITGRCVCGADPRGKQTRFSVFQEEVTCGVCVRELKHRTGKEGKSEGKSG